MNGPQTDTGSDMWLELNDIFWLFLVLTGCGAWWHNLKQRESATRAVKRHCQREGLQLLDDSIALKRMKPIRDRDSGRLVLLREYQFFFTSTGDERYPGSIQLQGRRLLGINLAPHRIQP